MILHRLIVHFSRSAEMLGAAIIAHGTQASDVTYVLLNLRRLQLIHFIVHCNEKIALVELGLIAMKK